MTTGSSGTRREPLYVMRMALALVAAAFAGAAFGLVWHAVGFGTKAEEPATAPQAGR